MKLKHFRRAIHWDQIILYFVAFWLCSHAFLVFACLFDLHTAENVRTLQPLDHSTFNTGSLNTYMAIGRVVGIFIGFAYAISLARSRGGNWINPAIAFAVTLLLGLFNLLGWSQVKNVFLSPGSIFSGALYYLVDGIILLLLGGAIIYFNHKMKKKKSEDRRGDVDFA